MNDQDFYKEQFPLVDIPKYTEKDISDELDRTQKSRSLMVRDWFTRNFLIMWSFASIINIAILFYVFSHLLETNAELNSLFTNNQYLIALFIVLFMAPWIALMCPYPKWYKKVKRIEAEFNVRAKLCKSQLKGADEKLTMQIFDYCNTYPK
jgi:uncharacterized membrane protein